MVSAAGVVDVATGMALSCVVVGDTTRQVQCVGDGSAGQLGRDATASSSVLGPVAGELAGVSEVFCGPSTSFAIKDGQVHAWGFNMYGGLGVATSGSDQVIPALVSLPVDFNATQVAAGYGHSCFLSSAGEVRCAGLNDQGHLGDAGSVNQATPVAVDVSLLTTPGTTKFISLSAGEQHTCATATDNMVYCWGVNPYSQLGSDDGPKNKPTPIPGITTASFVWTGKRNTFVIDNNPLGSSGAVALGFDAYGVFGLGGYPEGFKTATPLVFGENVTGIVELRGGYKVTCILNVLGEVWCTGKQEYGQFGRGTGAQSLVLVQMEGLPTSAPTNAPTSSPTSSTSTNAPTTNAPTTSQPTNAPTLPTSAPTSSSPTTSGADANAATTGAIVSAVLAAAAVVTVL